MAPLSTNAISHFTHPGHKLNHLTSNTSYICDGCNVPGIGPRFTCTICSFDLHDYCAMCPNNFTPAIIIHQHPMNLVAHKPKTNQNESCQICHNSINGLAYHCNDCNFWIHTHCVSANLGVDDQDPSSSPPVAQSISEQIEVGLETKWICDEVTGELNDVSSVGLNVSVSLEVPSADLDTLATIEEDGCGLFDVFMSCFVSIFLSSSA